MLKDILIDNYILIDKIKIEFDKGFTVLTGETGAGKSVLIGALSLVLGKRADAGILLSKDRKCIIEASFDISDLKLEDFFEVNDIDFDSLTIVRREINPAGKSRAFINDTPVTLKELKELTGQIIDLHSQNENLSLTDSVYRINLIDSIAGTIELYNCYFAEYMEYKALLAGQLDLKEKLRKALADADFIKFQIEQINSINLKSGSELEELENEASLLENAEEIQTVLSSGLQLLSDSDNSVQTLLKALKSSLQSIAKSYQTSEELILRLESVIIELKDIEMQFSIDADRIEVNPELLVKVNDRIDSINNLLRKHNCTNPLELFDVLEDFKSMVLNTESLEQELAESEINLVQKKNILKKLANDLSTKRRESYNSIEETVIFNLKQLGIPNSSFKINNNYSEEFTELGFDNIDFLFSANKNMPLEKVEKVASGGELSRLMLTVKSLMAKGMNLPGIIFDEVDTGVSGEIADKMAELMLKISNERQVISITHLPQVAAKGKNHLKVIKDESGERSKIIVKTLKSEERIMEIASMISGSVTTPQAIENARILMHS